MKKLFLLVALVGCFALNADAQSCQGKYKTAKSTASASCSATDAAAAKAASLDTSIERKVCSKSGKVSYVKNSVCPSYDGKS